MPSQYNWKRRWILLGTREDQPASAEMRLQKRLLTGRASSQTEFSLDELADTPVLILLGEPGIGKSSELKSYFQRARAAGGSHIWRMEEYPPRDFDNYFNRPDFQEWRSCQCNLILFLDSFDESTSLPIDLGRDLIRALRNAGTSLGNLYLRIACRTADWSEDTSKWLKELFGENNVKCVELDTLGRQDVVDAAIAHGIDGHKFIEQIEQNALTALTLKPITLIDLLKKYHSNDGVLPDTRNDLYKAMGNRLCEEHNLFHDENDRRGNYTVAKLFAEAARLAVIMLTTRRLSVWMPSSTSDMPDGSVAVTELNYGSFAEERLVRAVLHTGFFSSRGANQLGWAHLSFAEYLSAVHMYNEMDLSQIKRLLVHPVGDKIVPQLREVAAWIATMDPSFLKFLLDLDPEGLFQSELIVEDGHAREYLTTKFLDLYHREVLVEIPGNGHSRYRRFKHPRLAEQLVRFVHDSSRNEKSRYVAIGMIHACELQDAADNLLDLALDPAVSYQLRKHAAYVIARNSNSKARLELKQLILGDVLDVDDDLKGAGLLATWPDHLTAPELFKALTPRRTENYFGFYSFFLQPEIINNLPNDDLPKALQWAANYVKQYTDPHYRIDSMMQNIIDEIVYKSWLHFEIPDVDRSFARLVLEKISHYHPLFGTERMQEQPSRYQAVMEDFSRNAIQRRRILLCAFDLVTKPDYDFNALSHSIPLLQHSDLEWLIELLQEDSTLIAKPMLLRLIGTVFRHWAPGHMDMVSLAMEKSDTLRQIFDKWFYVPLDSEYASEQRLAHKREQDYQREMEENEARRNKQRIDPPPLSRLADILDQCERGEIEVWWQTNIFLAADEYGRFDDWHGDIRKMPNWERLEYSSQKRLIVLGSEYLSYASNDSNEWFCKEVLWRPALAAHRILFLLHDLNYDIPRHIWQKWMPAVIAFPSDFIRSEHEKHWKFVAVAYQKDGDGFRQHLRNFLTCSDNNIGIIENYLLRFKDCIDIDDQLAQVFLGCLDEPNIRPEHYRGVLSFLLDEAIPAAGNRAMSDFRNQYKANKRGDEAVRLAANLVASPIGGDWWSSIWDIIQTDEDFGRRVVEKIAVINDHRRLAIMDSSIPEKAIADLYLWIAERYPPQEDPDLYGSGLMMQTITSRHDIANWRNSLLDQLAERGTPESLEELNRIGAMYPSLQQLNRLRKHLTEHLYKNTWSPPQVRDVLSILRSSDQRLVQTGNQLFDLVIESLDRLQIRLQGETPSAVDLWNRVPKEAICRPKDEKALSNYVKRHLEQDLIERGIVVNREVEIRQKEGGEGAAAGEIPDLYVSAFSQNPGNNEMRRLVVLIEVKGNWHDELKTAAQTQLVERYLRDNDRATCGLYLVGWFNCQQWDQKDHRRRPAMSNEYDSLRQELKAQAAALSGNSLDVRSYVLNVALRDEE